MKPEKLPLQSADGAQINLDMLYQIVPSCFTEARGADGKVRRIVNFDILRQLLGDATADTGVEFYQFTWPGKAEARREAARSIRKTLRPVPEDSVDWDTTQNLYIEGDNLEVLKLLQKSYMGKVKMIYIDPPYNTGKDFVYHDRFGTTLNQDDRMQDNTDEYGNRYRKNLDSNGRFHSDWCSMIYSRLLLARTLLSEDGVIFISIDDNEVENLKKLCNEVFGASNFIAQLATVMNLKGNNDQFGFAGTHEYTLVYAKSLSEIEELRGIALTKEDEDEYELKDTKGAYKIGATLMRTGESGFREKRPKGFYPIYVSENLTSLSVKRESETDIIVYPRTREGIDMSWRRSPENLVATRDQFVIKKTSTGISFYKKQYLSEDRKLGKKPKSLFYKSDYSSGNGTAQIKELFKGRTFDNPKPLALIQDICMVGSLDDSIIVDFFSGSATTAHAVMKLNSDDGGKRKFILVQLPEKTEEGSEARKAGYENICEIGKERIRRAGRKIKEDAGLQGQNLDTGFRVFRVDESNMEDVYFQPASLSQDQLDLFLDNVKPGRTDLDLLFGAMLDWGVQLSLPMLKATIDGCNVYTVNDGDLVACFAEKITENVIAHIADQSPLRVLFRDSCFKNDADKINIFEQFKQRLGWSDEEAMKNIRVI